MAEARSGHADKVRAYLDKGCDIETRNTVIYANIFNYLMIILKGHFSYQSLAFATID